MIVFVYGYDNRCDHSETYGVASNIDTAKEKALAKYTTDAQVWDMHKGKTFYLNPPGVFRSEYSDVITINQVEIDGETIRQFEFEVNENDTR